MQRAIENNLISLIWCDQQLGYYYYYYYYIRGSKQSLRQCIIIITTVAAACEHSVSWLQTIT